MLYITVTHKLSCIMSIVLLSFYLTYPTLKYGYLTQCLLNIKLPFPLPVLILISCIFFYFIFYVCFSLITFFRGYLGVVTAVSLALAVTLVLDSRDFSYAICNLSLGACAMTVFV